VVVRVVPALLEVWSRGNHKTGAGPGGWRRLGSGVWTMRRRPPAKEIYLPAQVLGADNPASATTPSPQHSIWLAIVVWVSAISKLYSVIKLASDFEFSMIELR
jgi:hypothetical protein